MNGLVAFYKENATILRKVGVLLRHLQGQALVMWLMLGNEMHVILCPHTAAGL
jgi:hypothetical protein